MITETLMNIIEGTVNQNLHRAELQANRKEQQYGLPTKNSKNNKLSSYKLLIHKDLDGSSTGVLLLNQLMKQGVPKERIEIDFGQYGDKNLDLLKSTTPKNAHQGTIVGDFAALPKEDIWDNFNKLFSFKANPSVVADFINSRDWTTVQFQQFISIMNKFNFEKTKWTDDNLKNIYAALVAYSRDGLKKTKPITAQNIKDYGKINLSRPDFVTDHHDNVNGKLYGGNKGQIAVSAKSNAEYIAKHYAPGIMSNDDIDAISMVDSAGYTHEELENTLFLQKHFTGKDKKRNLATLLNTLMEQLIKKDPESAKWVIKNSAPNLVSIYDHTLKAMRFSGKKLELYTALSSPDSANKIEEIKKSLPNGYLPKNYTEKDNYKDIKPLLSIDDWRKKNLEDKEINKTGFKDKKEEEELKAKKKELGRKASPEKDEINKRLEELKNMKGKLYVKGSFMVSDNGNLKGYQSRYQNSLATEKGYERPYTLKIFPSMVQVAINSDYGHALDKLIDEGKARPEEKPDFQKVGEVVRKEYRNWLVSKGLSPYKIKEIMADEEENTGGHASAIWNFQGFEKISPTSKEGKGRYYDLKNIMDRVEKVGKDPKTFLPKKYEEYQSLDNGVMQKYRDLKQDAIHFCADSFIKNTEKMYPYNKQAVYMALRRTDNVFDITKK